MMKRLIFRPALGMIVVFVLAGCSNKPPSCSDEEVLGKVKQIIISAFSQSLDSMGLRAAGQFDDGTGLSAKNVLADTYDPSVKRLSCHADFEDERMSFRVSYVSQLDDNGSPVVRVDINTIEWGREGVMGQGRPLQSRANTPSAEELAKQQIENIGGALDLYKLDVGGYPTTEQGLAALHTKPSDVETWNGPYTKTGGVPADPWNHPWAYHNPSSRQGHDYDLCSPGPNGQASEPGQGEAICNP